MKLEIENIISEIKYFISLLKDHANFDDSKKKLSFDLFYLKNFSIWFDFLILLKTIRLVILKKGSEPI